MDASDARPSLSDWLGGGLLIVWIATIWVLASLNAPA